MGLPRKPRPPKSTMPGTMIIMAKEKSGKSTISADLTTKFAEGRSLILSLGETGYDALEANVHECFTPKAFLKTLSQLKEENEELKDGEYSFDFLIVDHCSKIDEWSEMYGTLNYMASNMGKNWNFKARETNPNAVGPGFSGTTANQYYLPNDPKFKSVYSLGDGAGYRFGRSVAYQWLYDLEVLAPHVIFIAHNKIDRYSKDDTGAFVNSERLGMTGAIATKYAQHVDCLASLSRKGNEAYLSFKSANSDIQAGSRYAYLEGEKFLISRYDKETKTIETFWENIFPDYKSKPKK